MRAFANLFRSLDETTSTNRKIDAMVDYFTCTPGEDAVWAVSFLMGRRPRRVIPTRKLMQYAAELAETPEWLFDILDKNDKNSLHVSLGFLEIV